MANLTTSGTSGYPASIDTSTTLVDGTDEIIAENVNGPTAAVINIETELGTAPRGSATDVVTRLNVSQNADGTIKSSVIVANTPTSVSYAGGVFTLTTTPNSNRSGNLVQMVSTAVTGFTTTNGSIPADNTPPQSSEGSGFGLSIDMKPTSTLNTVYVKGNAHVDIAGGANQRVVWALFLAGSTSAVTGGSIYIGAASTMSEINFLWKATTVSTATTTYALRIGNSGAFTTTLNGENGAALYNNSVTSIIQAYEVQN